MWKFDLADAYFRKGSTPMRSATVKQVSVQGQQDDVPALLGDIHAHLGDVTGPQTFFASAINRNPDNDNTTFRSHWYSSAKTTSAVAEQTLTKGLARIPRLWEIHWGFGIVSCWKGKPGSCPALRTRRRLLPECRGAIRLSEFFYYQTGQSTRPEVLNRFKGSSAAGGSM